MININHDKYHREQQNEMILSLYSSIQEAGGHINCVNINTMTVSDLIELLATNNIRFVYRGNQNEIF